MQEDSNPSLLLQDIPQLENIEILSFLGQGGMSTVYKGRQTDLDRIVAVKVLSQIRETSAVKRFRNEAKLACNLHHPNIIKTYGFDVSEDGQPYIVLEFIEGESLSELLKKNKQLSLKQFREVFVPVLDALEIAHQKGLIHRDLKPANIMLCKTESGDTSVKLVDFGIAKQYGNNAETKNLTGTGDIIGTPQYMSPEQCQGIELDNRSDLYAISCVMYEALLGESVFLAESAMALMQKHYQTPPPTSKELCRRFNVDKDLISTILDGLAKAKANRPQSAREMAARIDRALSGQVLAETVCPRKRLSARVVKAMKIAILVSGLVLGLAATKPIIEFISAIGHPVSKRRLDVHEANKIRERGDNYKALEKFDEIIGNVKLNTMNKYNQRQAKQIGYAYFRGSACIYVMKEAAGTKAPEGSSKDWISQCYFYADTAKKIAEVTKDLQLYIESQRQKALLFEPKSRQQTDIILGILNESENFWNNSTSQEYFAFKQEQLTRIIISMKFDNEEDRRLVKDFILREIKKSDTAFGTESLPSMRAQAIYAQFLARTNERTASLEKLGQIEKRLYSDSTLNKLPVPMRSPVLGSIMRALETAKDPALAEKFLKLELKTKSNEYEQIKQRAGDLYCSLAQVYLASGDEKTGITKLLDALELCSKDENPDMDYINNPQSPFSSLNILSPKMTNEQKTRFESIKQKIWNLPVPASTDMTKQVQTK